MLLGFYRRKAERVEALGRLKQDILALVLLQKSV